MPYLEKPKVPYLGVLVQYKEVCQQLERDVVPSILDAYIFSSGITAMQEWKAWQEEELK